VSAGKASLHLLSTAYPLQVAEQLHGNLGRTLACWHRTRLLRCSFAGRRRAHLLLCCSLADAALVFCSVCSPHVYGPQPDSIPLFAGAKTTIQSRADT